MQWSVSLPLLLVITLRMGSCQTATRYNGLYQGECDQEGFYYSSENTYVVCTHGFGYELPCAPGSKNSPFIPLEAGATFGFREFCDVNMLNELVLQTQSSFAQRSGQSNVGQGSVQASVAQASGTSNTGQTNTGQASVQANTGQGSGQANNAQGNFVQTNGGQVNFGQRNSVQSIAGQVNAPQPIPVQASFGQSNTGQGNSGQGNFGQGNGVQSNVGQVNFIQGNAAQGSFELDIPDQGSFGQGNVAQGVFQQGNTGQGNAAQSNAGQLNFVQDNNVQSNVGLSNLGQGNAAQGIFGQGNAAQGIFGQVNQGQGNIVTTTPPAIPSQLSQRFRGIFAGSCPQDGFYYSTQAAFIECANGLAFEVFCAPGSQNPPAERFMVEMTYTYQSFCGDNAPRTDTAPVSQTTTPGAGLADGIKYNGFFPGECVDDGFYYSSLFSFIECSNGRHFEIECATGTQNRPLGAFTQDSTYDYRSFCDVFDERIRPSTTSRTTTADPADQVVVLYHGLFQGSCTGDGFYYNTLLSFVECANGIAYEVTCAAGSRNPAFESFSVGANLDYMSFCNLNAPDLSAQPGVTVTQGTTTFPTPSTTSDLPGQSTGTIYRGFFNGMCSSGDGFYYFSLFSFYECANNEAFQFGCPVGTQNGLFDTYVVGSILDRRQFCNVMSQTGLTQPLLSATPSINAGGLQIQSDTQQGQAIAGIIYRGIFNRANPCPQDGFYYITRDMFAECANQLPFERQCPAGTQNPNLGTFIVGLAYSHNIFCSLNDNDQLDNRVETNTLAPTSGVMAYRGEFNGCRGDGFYYLSDREYILCASNMAFRMPCAANRLNPRRDLLVIGGLLDQNSFCNIVG